MKDVCYTMKIVSWNVNGIRSVMAKANDGTRLTKTSTAVDVLTSVIDASSPDII